MSCFWSEFPNEVFHFEQILEETEQLQYRWRNRVLSEHLLRSFLSAFLGTLHDVPVYRTFLRDSHQGPGVFCRSLAVGTLWWGPVAVTGVFHDILQLDICSGWNIASQDRSITRSNIRTDHLVSLSNDYYVSGLWESFTIASCCESDIFTRIL